MKDKCKIVAIGAILCLFMAGCWGMKITKEQEDAGIRTAGNVLGLAVSVAKPELIVPLKIYCQAFLDTKDAIEAGQILNIFMSYLGTHYLNDSRIADVTENFLTTVGFSEEVAKDYINGKIDKIVGKQGLTEDVFHKSLLAMTGFCQMI